MKCTPQKNSDCLNGVKQSILFLFATLLLLKTFSLVQNTSIISIQSSVIRRIDDICIIDRIFRITMRIIKAFHHIRYT